jgi:hypothetical protein
MKKTTFAGDLHITEPTLWENGHYAVQGHLYLEKGGVLIAKNCTIELECSYSREFNYRFRGGKLITENVHIGGSNKDGIIRHCNFEIDDGEWESKDTTVQYTYGQIFLDPNGRPKLTGTRHNAGVSPDSVIMTNAADVELYDSNFAISMTMECSPDVENRDVSFSLPLNTPVTMTMDGGKLPGASYSLKLNNCTVPLWFLFMNGISSDAPPMRVTLDDCPSIIPSFLGGVFEGEYHLPIASRLRSAEGLRNQTVRFGNLELVVGDKPCYIPCWGIYTGGPGTDLTFTGESNICELFFDSGTVRLFGDKGTYNMYAQATTYDVGKQGQNNGALLTMRDCYVAKLKDIQGQVTTWGDSEALIEDCIIGRLRLITKDTGKITVRNCTVKGELVQIQDGGEIVLENVTWEDEEK